MNDKKSISDEDSSLFRDAVGDVKPVNNNKRIPDLKRPAPIVNAQSRDNASVMKELMSDYSDLDLLETGEHLSYTASGIQRGELRKLKSGKYAIRAELDLHGLNREEAHVALRYFIETARERDNRCVRIIHGKGLNNSDRAPVLKRYVDRWLRYNKHILAFCSARENDGGTGALYALLRKG